MKQAFIGPGRRDAADCSPATGGGSGRVAPSRGYNPVMIALSTLAVTGLLERHVLERPWITLALLGGAALLLAWRGLGSGERRPLVAAGACAAAAVVVLLLSMLVTTPAERGAAVVRAFVTHAERGETDRMLDLLAPNATFHYGRPENPGLPNDEIRVMVRTLEGRYRIEANTVTQLDATAESRSAATVLLTNRTSVAAGYDFVPNSWWLRVARQPDGAWRIERIAFLRVAGQDPTGRIWR